MESVTLLKMIQKQKELSPNKTAVVFGNQKLTYNELDIASDNLAYNIKKEGIKQKDFVILYAQKSLEMVVAVIAAIKIGCTYVPVDIRYPFERIQYIINDCNPKAILAYNTCTDKYTIPVIGITIDTDYKSKYICADKSTNIVYCIYTSGTTGKPKGVLIKDCSVVNLVKSYKKIYGMITTDVILQFASIAFDQSVWDIFIALTLGCTLCVVPQKYIEDISLLEQYMIKNNVTVAALTPAFLRELHPERLPDMRAVESGGAAVERVVVEKWKHYCRVFNTYGPTEATVNALTYEITDDIPENIPIGKPIDNMEAYVISEGKLCLPGEVGELCLSGIGLAEGYLNNETLNKEKFIRNIFGNGLLYRTGDLVKVNEDGDYLCIGRIDSQVKIRGFRVDLSEIEHVLSSIGSNAVIIEKNQLNDNIIVAFIVCNCDVKDIKHRIAQQLPDYMIPSLIIKLKSIPLNVSGKTDVAELHKYYIDSLENRKRSLIGATDNIEKCVLNVLERVLNLNKVGLNDNYIELGGNSINAIRVITELRELGLQAGISDLLTSESLFDYCKKIKYREKDDGETPEQEALREAAQAHYQQKIESISRITGTQMYMYKAYLDRKVGDNFLQYVYNIECSYNYSNLRDAIRLLFEQYDVLSSRFWSDGKLVYQLTFKETTVPIVEKHVTSLYEMTQFMEQDVIDGFCYDSDVLIRFVVFLFPNGIIKLLCSVSHMIVDGWSMDLLQKALINNYMLLQEGMSFNDVLKNNLNIKRGRIAQYNRYIEQMDFSGSKEYWDAYFNDCGQAVITFPHDQECNSNQTYHEIVEWLDPHLSTEVKKLSKAIGVTENTLFEYAFASLLSMEDPNKRKDVLFTKVVSGRDVNVENIDAMVGTMINIIPQRILLKGDFVSEVRELNGINIKNMSYDKFDFYSHEIDGKALMEYAQTMLIFCNYYSEKVQYIVYEYDRDQDDIDLSMYVDSVENGYRILLTCKKSAYSDSYARGLIPKLSDILSNFVK